MVNVSAVPTDAITEIGRLGLALQALGIAVVLAIIFDIVAFLINRKRLKEIHLIKQDMARIEGKIDVILVQNKMKRLK